MTESDAANAVSPRPEKAETGQILSPRAPDRPATPPELTPPESALIHP